jgi:hypothetical protein
LVGEVLTVSMSFPAAIWTALVLLCAGFWVLSGVFGLEADGLDGAEAGLGEGTEAGDGLFGAGSLLGLLGALGLNRVPLPVAATVATLFGWLFTMIAVQVLGAEVSVVVGVVLLVVSVPVALTAGGLAVRPLGPLYEVNRGMSQHELIGRICTVRTERVDGRFGQATVTDAEGAAHVIHVRFPGTNQLTTGSKALIVDVDDGIFRIDPDTAGLE